jgi:hypothetical protein
MGRRTSGQQVGLQTIGNLQANASTLTTTQTNQNLTIDPNGTGTVDIQSSISITGDVTIANQGDLRLREASGSGTNYIAMQAAATMAADYTITWPAAVSGTNGFFLASDTNGVLSWTSAAGNIAVSDPGASATVHYPFFGTNAGSLPATLSPLARSNLSFIPSTGILTATGGFVGPTHDGGSSNSGTLTIRGTSSATKATASVLMTDGVASTTTTTGTLVVTGGVGISGQMTAASIVETSSIVYKQDVNPITDALDSVMQLVGVTYARKDTHKYEAGLIAEDVDKILPNLVSKNAEGNPEGIQYTKLTAYLIEAVKSLKAEIDQLKGVK